MAIQTPRLSLLAILVAGAIFPGAAASQSYRDFMIVRNREQPFRSLFQVRAGYRGVDPEGENLDAGLTDDAAVDGFVYFHTKQLTSRENYVFDAYAGQDGIYLGLKDDLQYGKKAQTRLELFGRPKAFYREGFYRDGDYLITGQYEGRDYGVRITSSQAIEQGLILDLGVFYRKNEFERNEQTEIRPDFIIPDDYNAFGGQITLEQNTIKRSRVMGLPQAGSLLSIQVEYERNDSDRTWGSSLYRTTLPSGFYRGQGRIEFYVPNGKTGVWEILLDGGYMDSADRVTSYNADRMQGHIWADAKLGYRLTFGESFVFKPFLQGQFTKILDETGVTSDEEFFYGGGLDAALVFGENMSLVLNYSYVNNPSRRWASLAVDNYGEHQLFFGLDVLFGSGYRR